MPQGIGYGPFGDALLNEQREAHESVEYLLDRGRVMLAKIAVLERQLDVLHIARQQLLEER